MECTILETKCRLCGSPFDELLCLDGSGEVWNDAQRASPENWTPWCPRCLQRMNETCDILCADVSFGSEQEDLAEHTEVREW